MNAVNPEGERRVPAEASARKTCPSCGTRYPADALFCALDGSPLTTAPAAIAAASATDPYLGREISGHIEIRQLVGIGAMGRVYRAFQKGIDRDVAVKILHRELSSNPTVVARFHREAKVASRLAHPHVVHVLLVGQLPDGAMYIVMEFLDGMSLQSALAAAGGAMPLPRALHIALQLCDAAGEAHAQAIVHRDLKPENVMLVKRADDPDFVKVLDFGIARLNWGEQSMATAAGLIFGTARYISPEGARGEKVGPPGDVYSVATMVYQMLSGLTPFDGDQAVALLVQQIHDSPRPLTSIARAAYVPEPIAAVVMKNLSKKIEERADSARTFGRALLEAAVTSGLSAQDILARPSMLAAPGRPSHASVVQMPSMQRTRQLQLEPDAEARMAGRPERATAFETPAPSLADGSGGAAGGRGPTRTEIAEPATLPAGAETTKWSPPADFERRVAPPPASSVDSTMDDQQPPATQTVPIRPAAQATAPPSGVSAPRVDTTAPSTRTAPAQSRPPSTVDTTLADERLSLLDGRRSGHALTLVVACFLVGALGMAGIAWKVGLLGGASSRTALLDAVVARANDALVHQRWDTPPGNNVRDLTDDGLARWPNDSRLLGVRSRAVGEVLKAALVRHAEGDTGEAVRLARVATAFDPADEQAQKLLAEWASETTPATGSRPDSSVPPLAGARPSPSSTAASGGTVRAVLDASNGKPGLGQPVDFSARIVNASGGPRAKVDGARFRISGPSLAAGTELAAQDDGSGVFRTTFTFFEAGRFEVTFSAHADGASVRSTRLVVVGEPKALPPVPTSGAEPGPTPAPSAKWL